MFLVFGIFKLLYVDAENLEYHQDNVRTKDNLLVTTFCRVLVLIYFILSLVTRKAHT